MRQFIQLLCSLYIIMILFIKFPGVRVILPKPSCIVPTVSYHSYSFNSLLNNCNCHCIVPLLVTILTHIIPSYVIVFACAKFPPLYHTKINSPWYDKDYRKPNVLQILDNTKTWTRPPCLNENFARGQDVNIRRNLTNAANSIVLSLYRYKLLHLCIYFPYTY